MIPLVYVLVIGIALFSIVGVMVVVLREKHDEQAHLRYVRSPWPEVPVVPKHEAPADVPPADEAAPVNAPVGGDPGEHASVIDEPKTHE